MPTITEKILALTSKNDLRKLLSIEIPDAEVYNSYPEEDFHSILAVVMQKFGRAGVEVIQTHEACLLHGGENITMGEEEDEDD